MPGAHLDAIRVQKFSEADYKKVGMTSEKLLRAFAAARRQQRRPTMTAAQFLEREPDQAERDDRERLKALQKWCES